MEVVYRSIIIFIVLFIIMKFLGKKQIKQLTLYDYIIGITIGSIAGDSIIDFNTPLLDGVIALVIFGIIGYVSSYITYQSHKTAELIDGEPLVLFENNQFIYENLHKCKLSVAKVLENCRLKGCFDINDLECAIQEPSGDISILLKGNSQPLTSKDIKENIQKNSSKQSMNYLIIVDGTLDEEELKRAKKNKNWLKTTLKKENISIENIALLTVDTSNKVTIIKQN